MLISGREVELATSYIEPDPDNKFNLVFRAVDDELLFGTDSSIAGENIYVYHKDDHIETYLMQKQKKIGVNHYGLAFENIVKEFITVRQKKMLCKMIGFKFTKDKNYNLPARRLKAIEAHLQKRTGELLEIQNDEKK